MKNSFMKILIAICLITVCCMSLACTPLDDSSKESEHTCNFVTLTSDATHHWYACECGEISEKEEHKGGTATTTEQAKCEVCDTPYGELAQPEHTCNFAILTSDATHHWYACECGEISEKEEHKGGTATTTEQAKCEVCDTPYGELAQPEHTCNFATLTSDATHHWYACECGEISEKEEHKGGTATTTEQAKCEVCDTPYGELAQPEEEEVELLYHLKFEENVTDELGGSTVANGELSYVEGYNGKAVVLDNGYVALDFTPGTSSYSVAFWLKTSGISGDPAFFGNKDWDRGADLGFVFVMRNNLLYFNFADAGNRTDVSTSLPSTWKMEWTHYTIAVDREANVVRVAYNFGEFIELAIDEENRNSSFNGLDGVNLGQDGTGEYSCDFTATMDDFMLVSGVLTQENVGELKSYYGWTPDNSREHESLPTPTKDSEGYITNYVKDVELKNYLTFDEKASDECGATTEANGNLVYKDGIYGKAVDLSDGYISIKDYAPGKESFSVSFWLKTTGVSGDPAIFSNKNWNSGGSNGYIFALNGNGAIVFNVACDGERTDKWTNLPADFSKGWVHVAIVVDREANEIRIAFDFGEFVTLALDEPDKNSSFDGLGVLNIGQDGTGEYSCDFTAVMDEFMLFGGVLSENDIAALEEYYGMNE